jgi:hypothetical protein
MAPIADRADIPRALRAFIRDLPLLDLPSHPALAFQFASGECSTMRQIRIPRLPIGKKLTVIAG